MYTTKYKGNLIVSMTLTLKVNLQGHVTNFGLFAMIDYELVRIKSVFCIKPNIRKVI